MDIPEYFRIGVSVVVYCLSVSAVPIYNKLVFSGGDSSLGTLGLRKYPYPIATAFLQLSAVGAVLSAVSVVRHALCGRSGKSWLFGPHMLYKLRHVAPVGLLFGVKYGVTNWGLQLVPVGMHLLLQSSDLLWTLLAARFLNGERPGFLEHVAALLSTVGSVLIAAHAVRTLEAPLVPLLVNLLTPLVLALCISTLRSGTQELFRDDNPLHGSMTSTEFTALKMVLSAVMALTLAMLLEGGSAPLHRTSWWTALAEEPAPAVAAILFGGVWVLIFQVNLTWLTGLTSAVTVGIVGGIKVVPQWLLNAAFHLHVNLSPLNVTGACLVLAASVLYAAAGSLDFNLVRGPTGPVWVKALREPLTSSCTCGEDVDEACCTLATAKAEAAGCRGGDRGGAGPWLSTSFNRPAVFFDIADTLFEPRSPPSPTKTRRRSSSF